MLKHFAILSALAISTAAAAHADTVTGYFSATGTDSFTSSTITFDGSVVAGAIGGTFASYLTDGNPVNFLSGALPYSVGTNTPPTGVYPNGAVPIFTTSENGATFTFEMTQYTAGYITDGTMGCSVGGTCLDVTGTGYFLASGAVNGTSGPSTFTFTSQYVNGQPVASVTSFSASAAVSPVPEPSSLVLLATGLTGAAGMMRRRFAR